jgi:hypothetical protein
MATYVVKKSVTLCGARRFSVVSQEPSTGPSKCETLDNKHSVTSSLLLRRGPPNQKTQLLLVVRDCILDIKSLWVLGCCILLTNMHIKEPFL